MVIFSVMNFVHVSLRFLVCEMAKPTLEMEDGMYMDWARETYEKHAPRAKELDREKAREKKAARLANRLRWGEGYPDSDSDDDSSVDTDCLEVEGAYDAPSPPPTPTHHENLCDAVYDKAQEMRETRSMMIFCPWDRENSVQRYPHPLNFESEYELPASYLNLTQEDVDFVFLLGKVWSEEPEPHPKRARKN